MAKGFFSENRMNLFIVKRKKEDENEISES